MKASISIVWPNGIGYAGTIEDPAKIAALRALVYDIPAEAHCATCSCVPGMTPAIRFDATAAEKEGAVREQLIRMGWTPPVEAQAQGVVGASVLRMAAEYHYAQATCQRVQSGNTSSHRNPRLEAWHRQVADAIASVTAPPSAPVGVDEATARRILTQFLADDPGDVWPPVRQGDLRAKALQNAINSALASQQPAADNRICSVCDGGPGNDGSCLCGHRKWEQPAPAVAPVGVDKETERRLIDVAASMLNDNNGKIGKRHFRADATAVVRRILKALAAAKTL